MKRMILVLTVALVMAAMMAVMAVPAFATPTPALCEDISTNIVNHISGDTLGKIAENSNHPCFRN